MARKVKKSVLNSMPYLEDYVNQKEEKKSSGTKTSSSRTSSSKTSSNKPSTTGRRKVKQSVMDSMPYLEKYTQQEDIAPVRSNVKSRMTTGQEERKWFQKGLFEDGYDFGDVTRTILGTAADAVEDLGTGVAGMGERLADAAMWLSPAANVAQQSQNSLAYNFDIKKYREEQRQAVELIKKDLYDEEKVAKAILAPVSFTTEALIGTDVESASVFGAKADELVQSGGQLLATAGLQAVGVPWWMTTGATTFGSEAENALNQGAGYDEAGMSAAVSAASEILTEKLSGGIKFGGKALDDFTTKLIARNISSRAGRTLAKLGVDMFGEGAEEVLSGVLSALGQKMTYADEKELKELFPTEDAWDSFIGGALLGGFSSGANAVKSAVHGVDSVTELNAQEQKVVDRLYQDRQKAEPGKSKSQIYDEVLNDLEKGYISTDYIEEVLGGETYSKYRKTAEWEDSLQKEYDTLSKEYEALYNMRNGDKSSKQADREAELKGRLPKLEAQLKDVRATSTLDQMKSQLGSEVYGLAQNTRLAESYNERARRGQAFEADLSRYDVNQQKVVQKAIDSGVLNNTNRTHELVDFVAKISADKGVLFDFTNNERLKTSGFAIEGKTVNGYVTKDGITLNVNSANALETTVGHEITHVLEGSAFYNSLKETIFEYARAKGEYQTRYDSLSKLYQNIKDADVEKELVADLVGDYLFKGSDFAMNLSVQDRNIFERIYDEIKYLCKVVTAGSKEARKLEKVKREFERAYRERSQISDEAVEFSDATTKYSIREEAPPQKTITGYKVFMVKDGKLYPPMVANPEGEGTPVGVWLNADVGGLAYDDKGNVQLNTKGRFKVKAGGKGTQGGSGELAFRPGWHLGEYPDASQFGRQNKERFVEDKNGKLVHPKELFPYDFVWARCEVAADNDYQLDAMSFGVNEKGKFERSQAGLPYIPEDGYYKYRTNASPDTAPWIISGAIKVVEILDDDQVARICAEHGVTPQQRQGFKPNKKSGYTGEARPGNKIDLAMFGLNAGQVTPTAEEVLAQIRSTEGTAAERKAATMELLKTLPGYAKRQINFDDANIIKEFGMNNQSVDDYRRLAEESSHGYLNDDKIYSPKYSISDSDGKQLTQEQSEYFKDSKVRDENGNLKVMYHGTQDAGFHVFDSKLSDDGSSFFFVDQNGVAASYSGTTETYEARTIRSVEDMNNFLAEIGYDHYEAVERNGKIELLENNEHVATKDTAQEIYEEFCWYEGVGDGDANYKVYLNLKNPLEVDAEGREWNDLPAVDNDAIQYEYIKVVDFSDDGKVTIEYATAGDPAPVTETVDLYEKFPLGLANSLSSMGPGDSLEGADANPVTTRDYSKYAREHGYDGVIFKNIYDIGGYGGVSRRATVAIAFDSNQIKSTANENPTGNPDIRYSVSEGAEELSDMIDSDGEVLTKAQERYFGEHGLKDDNGNLLKLYRSADGGRTVWDGRGSGSSAQGIYLTDDVYVARAFASNGKTVGDVLEVYAKAENPLIIDAQGSNYMDIPMPEDAPDWLEDSGDWEGRLNADKLPITAFANGHDAVIIRNVREGVGGEPATDVILRDSNQFKRTDNTKPTTDPDIRYSLSNMGEVPQESGYRATMGRDIALPIAENTAVAEESSVTETAPELETIEFPDDLAPVESELENLLDEEAEMRSVMEAYAGVGNIEAVNRLIPEYEAIRGKIQELQQTDNERMESIDDTDAPGEMEAPIFVRSQNYDPFEGVHFTDISRSTRSYSDRNPGARHFLEEAALGFGYDVANSTHGEKWYNDELYYASGGEKGFGGTSRHTTPDIEELKDTYGYTWDQLQKAAEDVAKGEFRSVAAKRVEYLCHKRLMEGYTDVDGRRYEPNQEYISFLNETFANEQRAGSFDNLLENADQYAPEEVIEPMEEVAPVLAEATPDTDPAPVYDSKEPAALKGQTTMFEPPKPNPQVATVLTKEAAIAKEKSGIGGKLVSALVDKGMVFENLSHKTGNMELQSKYNYALPSNTEARAQYLMENGATGVKSLKSIMKSAEKTGKANDFSYYLYHVHNIDRMTLEDRFDNVPNKTVFGETVTADVSRAEVAKLLKANPEFKAMAEDVYAYNRHLRKLMVDNGVISQETANLWEKMYPHYVPVRRVDSNGVNVSVPLDTRKTGVNNPVKKAIGGSSDILPLFNTMAQRTEQVYRAIARNSFGIELKNTLGTALETQQDTSVDGAIDNVVAQDELLKPGTMSNSPTFTVFENGERVEFEITEDMYDALKPAGKLLGYRNKALQKVGDARRNLLTVWNPVFALYRNPVKDIQDVAINSQHPVKTYANVPNAIFQIATGGKWAEEYHQNGGKSNTYFDSRTNKFKADDNFFKKVFGMPVRAVETAGEFIEEIPRLAEYIASRKNGRSVERSMLDSARVTTNFAAGGDFTKFLNSHGFTFLNASVQGASQHVRNFREAKEQGLKGYVKVLAKYTVAGLPGILLNSMLWDDDEEYEELSDYVKQNYYVVAKTEDGKFVRIPKGRTAAVMQNLMEQMQNLVTGDDEADFQTFFELFMNNIAPNNPIENNILAPIGQVLKNEAWYGGDLVPSRLQDLPAEEQYDESTDSISRWLGEKTGLSPYKINYLLDQYSGGLGDVFLPMLTPEAESGDDTLWGNAIAPWKKELTTDSVLNNKNPGDFYDLRDELEKISNSSNATEEDSMRTMYMDSVSWEMSDLYKQKREIQSGDLPDSEKYEAVREIQEQINELARNAMEGYNDVSINGLYSEVGDRRYNKDADSGKWYEIRAKNSDGSDNYYYQQEQKVTKGLGITPAQYWNNREEYNFAYDKPEQYALAQSVGGYQSYRSYTSELWDIKADKDENGKSISGSRKEKVIDWLNNLDADYGTKIILFKNEYNADSTYNYEIIDYLNSRNDLTYDQIVTILKYLDFTVDKHGNVYWD